VIFLAASVTIPITDLTASACSGIICYWVARVLLNLVLRVMERCAGTETARIGLPGNSIPQEPNW
jgi:hypothetical protein